MFFTKPFVYVISLVANKLHFTGFGPNEIPPWKTKDGSTVRIALALNSETDGPFQAEGKTPAVLAFGNAFQYLGRSPYFEEDSYFPTGSYIDMEIEQYRGHGQQSPYLQIFAGNDAICIAYIGQTMSDGTTMGWVGDMGRACGKPWYHSNVGIGTDVDRKYSPDCTWLDLDHSPSNTAHTITPAAMQIHMPSFAKRGNKGEIYSRDPATYCDTHAMMFSDEYFPTKLKNELWNKYQLESEAYYGGQGPKQRRQQEQPAQARNITTPQRLSPAFDHLVASALGHHSAQALCESNTSHGPDFVGLREGIFCDMMRKEHYPLCGGGMVEECFDWDTHELITGDGRVERNYSRVERWE